MNKALDLFQSYIGKDSSKSISPLMRWLNPTMLSVSEGELDFLTSYEKK